VLGAVILLVSTGGFARSLQRTYEKAWSLPVRGMRGTVEGIGGMFVLVTVLGLLTWLSHLVGGRLLALPIQVAVGIPLWLLFTSMMLSRRIPRRQLLPGAVVTAVGQVALGWWTAVYVPRLIATDAAKYGVIGVAFALVSWLVVVAYLIVASAVIGSVAGRSAAVTPPDPPGRTSRSPR
jgi:membrane protein